MRRGICLLILFLIIAGSAFLMSSKAPGSVHSEFGWKITLPSGWAAEQGLLKDQFSTKAVTFVSKESTKQELENWLKSETAKCSLVQPLTVSERNGMQVYSFSKIETDGKQFTGPRYDQANYISTKPIPMYLEDKVVEAHSAVFFDGIKEYIFSSQGGISSSEFNALLSSFKTTPVRKAISPSSVTQLSIFAPGTNIKVITRQEDREFIDRFVAAYNQAVPYRQDVGKAYPVVITLTIKNGSQIEISGGAFDFQTVRIGKQEFNLRGPELQSFFVPN